MSMRWLVPTASATSRNDRPPIPSRANASMSASSSCFRRRSSGGGGIAPSQPLATRLEALPLEVEVAFREAQHEHADHHADRPPLLDALPDERALGSLRDNFMRRQRRAARRPLTPRP